MGNDGSCFGKVEERKLSQLKGGISGVDKFLPPKSKMKVGVSVSEGMEGRYFYRDMGINADNIVDVFFADTNDGRPSYIGGMRPCDGQLDVIDLSYGDLPDGAIIEAAADITEGQRLKPESLLFTDSLNVRRIVSDSISLKGILQQTPMGYVLSLSAEPDGDNNIEEMFGPDWNGSMAAIVKRILEIGSVDKGLKRMFGDHSPEELRAMRSAFFGEGTQRVFERIERQSVPFPERDLSKPLMKNIEMLGFSKGVANLLENYLIGRYFSKLARFTYQNCGEERVADFFRVRQNTNITRRYAHFAYRTYSNRAELAEAIYKDIISKMAKNAKVREYLEAYGKRLKEDLESIIRDVKDKDVPEPVPIESLEMKCPYPAAAPEKTATEDTPVKVGSRRVDLKSPFSYILPYNFANRLGDGFGKRYKDMINEFVKQYLHPLGEDGMAAVSEVIRRSNWYKDINQKTVTYTQMGGFLERLGNYLSSVSSPKELSTREIRSLWL